MVISYSAKTEIVMVEAFYMILMKVSPKTVNVGGIEKDCEIVLI